MVDAQVAARRAGLCSDGDQRWASTRRILAAGTSALEELYRAAAALTDDESVAGQGVQKVSDVRLGPPVPDPEKIICLGLNYRDHAQEAGLPIPSTPMLFAKFSNSLAGPGDAIVLPQASEAVDYEAELAVVIGQRCKNVDEDEALGYVAGAMVLNDVSARDLQHATSQWLAGKAIDTFAPCGPALVLRDEIEDLQDLSISTRVNGDTVQAASTSLMIFSVAEVVSFLSRLMTLAPGDVIATGTPAGVGFTRDPQLLLRPGDMVEVEIEGLGRLANPVIGANGAEPGSAADRGEREEMR